jgi:phthiocerol/phenolphthiocerol synthesis type-I polyketide synthase E
MTIRGHSLPEGIAVVGMSGRYPGARNVEQFWEILRDGKETISYFTDDQLLEAGFDADMVRDPSFVKARPVYERPMDFDAPFFGYTPREAEIIDPQQRVFLECAWEALEDAGYDPIDYPGSIGMFGGSGMTYYLFGLIDNQRVMSTMGGLAVTTSNEKDYFATRAGYKLNLRGPCVTVQTACSTAHVGIIFGCQSLLTYQTDIALAGGATIAPSQMGGYYYTEGGIVSQDGHNRTFDASGQGTIFGSGAGVVVLKRLKDAVADGDTIHAVIRGFGINNDG